MPKYEVTYEGEMSVNKETHYAVDEKEAIKRTKSFKYPIKILNVKEIKVAEAGTYFIELDYERKSQQTKGSASFNLELTEGWTVDSIKLMLTHDFFCCDLAIKTIKKI